MVRQFSVAEARNRLTELSHHAEDDGPVRVTRRGKPVVVLVSERDYVKISGDASGFAEAAEAFRLSLAPDRKLTAKLRKHSGGFRPSPGLPSTSDRGRPLRRSVTSAGAPRHLPRPRRARRPRAEGGRTRR